MAQLVVRDLNEDIKVRLQKRAKRHGRSMEAEVREILQEAVAREAGPRKRLGTSISNRFSTVGLEHPIEELRGWAISPPDFAE